MTAAHHRYAWNELARRRVQAARNIDEPCGICGLPIDYSLNGNHRDGATADHPGMVMVGGDLLVPMAELRIAHRRCNSRLGAKVSNRLRGSISKTQKSQMTEPNNIGQGGRSLGAQSTTPAPQSRISLLRPPTTSDNSQIAPEDVAMLSGCTGGLPRFFTPSHPRAVASLYDARAEKFVTEEMRIDLRPWQRAVLSRALEVDAAGELCFHTVVVSVGRQSGKSWIIRVLTNIRQRLFTEEPQSMLHIGRIRDAARAVLINEPLMRWAKARDIVVRSANGTEQWRWPDDSTWDLSSLSGAYGRTANLVICDEVWDISRQAYFEGVQPTTAARQRAQTWFISAAHREATDLTPLMITRARDGRDGYMLADWGALPGDDLSDPQVWRRMGPHWDNNRARAISEAVEEKSFREQWANIWPDVLVSGTSERALPRWPELAMAPLPAPLRGGICAIDEARDASRFGCIRLVGTSLYYDEAPALEPLVAIANQCDSVVVGLTLVEPVVAAGLRHRPVKYGVRELKAFSPLFQQLVASGRLSHDHNPEMLLQAAGAVVTDSEQGKVLSARRSEHDILAIKLATWAVGYQRSSASSGSLRARIY